MYCYGNTNDGYLWCQIINAFHQDYNHSHQHINISNTIAYDILGVMDSLSHVSICSYISTRYG